MEINYAYQMTYTDPYLSLKLNQKTNKKLNQTPAYGGGGVFFPILFPD